MAILRFVRDRGRRLTAAGPCATAGPRIAAWVLPALLVSLAGCDTPDPEHMPDAILQRELGLTEKDRVHTVVVTGGESEVAEPSAESVPVGAFVQFVSGDWRVHELRFELDSLGTRSRAFLERTDQVASPPLLQRDARFVVSFREAPPGRYPYILEGNGRPGRGVVVVVDPGAG